MSPSVACSPFQEVGVATAKDAIKVLAEQSYLLDRDIQNAMPKAETAVGNYFYLEGGRKVFDSTCGAAVSCLGHCDRRVIEAIHAQMCRLDYCPSVFFGTDITEDAAKILIEGTGHKMSKVFICNSGSEATEGALKMAMQYFHEIGQPRYHFIVRKHSYHGNTLGALSTGGHIARRKIYEEALMKNVSCVSECNPYRQRLEGQTDVEFVAAKAAELDREFQRVGCNKVVAFMCEPISGAALGCAPYVPGYLAAMKVVCVKYGALFILDEIMSGMGRCGTLHAWQAEHSEKPGRDCVPDIQMIAKGVAAGFMPVGAFMVGPKVVGALSRGTGAFVHGQTYQAFPTCCAAIVKVQTIVRDENLLDNVRKQGAYLSTLLHQRLDSHPNVGDIRGMGLFWGIEFVEDKEAKEPFIPELNIAKKIRDLALSEKYGMTFYPGQGSKDGLTGDHIIIAPAYNITAEDVELIVDTAVAVIEETFQVL